MPFVFFERRGPATARSPRTGKVTWCAAIRSLLFVLIVPFYLLRFCVRITLSLPAIFRGMRVERGLKRFDALQEAERLDRLRNPHKYR